jgi:hypothetical protein
MGQCFEALRVTTGGIRKRMGPYKRQIFASRTHQASIHHDALSLPYFPPNLVQSLARLSYQPCQAPAEIHRSHLVLCRCFLWSVYLAGTLQLQRILHRAWSAHHRRILREYTDSL